MPIPINRPDFTTALREATDFRGRLAPRLDETITPVIVVGDVAGRGSAPGIVRRYTSSETLPAVAGERNYVRIQAVRSVLTRLVQIRVSSGTAGVLTLFLGNSSPALVGVMDPAPLEQRLLNSPRPSTEVAIGHQVASFGAEHGLFAIPASPAMATHNVDIRAILGGAGSGQIWLIYNALNVTLRLSLVWEEYQLPATES